jgi:hypothetical protein
MLIGSMSQLNPANDHYRSVRVPFFSSLLSKNLLIILLLLWSEACSLTIREARRLRMLKNIALRKKCPQEG